MVEVLMRALKLKSKLNALVVNERESTGVFLLSTVLVF